MDEKKDFLIKSVLLAIIFFMVFIAAENIFFSSYLPQNDETDNESEPPDDNSSQTENETETENPQQESPEIFPPKEPTENENNPPKQAARTEELVKAIEKFIEIASGEIGYSTARSTSKYAGYFDGGNAIWSEEFLAWCTAKTEEALNEQLSGSFFPWSDNITGVFIWFTMRDTFETSEKYVPLGGDYIFFDDNKDGLIDRTGLVVKVTKTTEYDLIGNSSSFYEIETIEANPPNTKKVITRKILSNDETIAGYGKIIS